MAIDVNPGPVRPIRLISDCFLHFHPFAEPALRTPDLHRAVAPAISSAPQPQPDPEPEGDSDDSAALGTLEFTLLFDVDNSSLHCIAHCQGLRPPASGSTDTYVKANLLPGISKASQLWTRTVRGTRGPTEKTLTYHGFTFWEAKHKTLWLCVCVCVCVCVWARGCSQRRVPPPNPPGELQVPLRKLVPNQAQSFSMCLERQRLTQRPRSLDASCGMSLYEVRRAVGQSREARDRSGVCRLLCIRAVEVPLLKLSPRQALIRSSQQAACCAAPTSPPQVPMAAQTPLSAGESEHRGGGQGPRSQLSPLATSASCTDGWVFRMVYDELTDPQETQVWIHAT
ncbi:LOW QUALITY PROTEIN: double C2-like domain-containing protein gamma [Rhynchonycteris naso]